MLSTERIAFVSRVSKHKVIEKQNMMVAELVARQHPLGSPINTDPVNYNLGHCNVSTICGTEHHPQYIIQSMDYGHQVSTTNGGSDYSKLQVLFFVVSVNLELERMNVRLAIKSEIYFLLQFVVVFHELLHFKIYISVDCIHFSFAFLDSCLLFAENW